MRVYRLRQGIDSTCIFYSSVEEGGASQLYEYGLFLRRKYRSLVRQKKEKRRERYTTRHLFACSMQVERARARERGEMGGKGKGTEKGASFFVHSSLLESLP
jgi:hypothetical protein